MILESNKSIKFTLIANSPIAQHALLATEMVSFSLEVFCCKNISRVNDRESKSWKHVKKENSTPYQLLSGSIKKFRQPRLQMNRTYLNARSKSMLATKERLFQSIQFSQQISINETHTNLKTMKWIKMEDYT